MRQSFDIDKISKVMSFTCYIQSRDTSPSSVKEFAYLRKITKSSVSELFFFIFLDSYALNNIKLKHANVDHRVVNLPHDACFDGIFVGENPCCTLPPMMTLLSILRNAL